MNQEKLRDVYESFQDNQLDTFFLAIYSISCTLVRVQESITAIIAGKPTTLVFHLIIL